MPFALVDANVMYHVECRMRVGEKTHSQLLLIAGYSLIFIIVTVRSYKHIIYKVYLIFTITFKKCIKRRQCLHATQLSKLKQVVS